MSESSRRWRSSETEDRLLHSSPPLLQDPSFCSLPLPTASVRHLETRVPHGSIISDAPWLYIFSGPPFHATPAAFRLRCTSLATAAYTFATSQQMAVIDSDSAESPSEPVQHPQVTLSVARREQIYAATLLRSDFQQEATLVSRLWRQHEEAAVDPAGRIRERFCMALRMAAWCEERELSCVIFPLFAAVSMLPRLHFLGQDIVARVLALRRVSTVVVDAGLALPTPSSNRRITDVSSLSGTHQHQSDGPSRTVHNYRHLVNVHAELDWMQRRNEVQELEALIRDIQTTYQPGWTPSWLPSSPSEMSGVLAAHHGYVVFIMPGQDSCDVTLCDETLVNGPRAVLRLPNVSVAKLERLAMQMAAARATDTPRGIRLVGPKSQTPTGEIVLAELWEVLVHPIIRGLGLNVCPPSLYLNVSYLCVT
jgi:hypothetical protein